MIDIQNDFCEEGSLAVPGASAIIPLANQLQNYFDHIIATKDWHPSDHINFAANHPGHLIGEVMVFDNIPQILWPKHCEQHSTGSEFHSLLQVDRVKKIIYKGTDKEIDSYSAFYDNAHLKSTGLYEYLRREHIQNIYLLGLATDYCIKYSALDAVKLGLHVYVIEDACRGIDLKTGDVTRAIDEMKAAGVRMIKSSDIMMEFRESA